jgi:hypothetical protein
MTTSRRIHVEPNGNERAPRGGELYMEVTTDGPFEFVTMRNAVSRDDSMSPVPPHGLGWDGI